MCDSIPTNLSLIPACSCGEPLDHEAEQDAGMCFNCQADEAGFDMPEPEAHEYPNAAQVDELCRVIHHRKAS